MDILNIEVSHRKTPPSACVEFIDKNGQSIEVERRGDDFVDMANDEIIRRAKATTDGASSDKEA